MTQKGELPGMLILSFANMAKFLLQKGLSSGHSHQQRALLAGYLSSEADVERNSIAI
jgi:hypothetical protein